MIPAPPLEKLTFDLINLNPIGERNSEPNDLARRNITTLGIEVPISCLTDGEPVIGGWTTASVRKTPGKGNNYVQVSRPGSPLT